MILLASIMQTLSIGVLFAGVTTLLSHQFKESRRREAEALVCDLPEAALPTDALDDVRWEFPSHPPAGRMHGQGISTVVLLGKLERMPTSPFIVELRAQAAKQIEKEANGQRTRLYADFIDRIPGVHARVLPGSPDDLGARFLASLRVNPEAPDYSKSDAEIKRQFDRMKLVEELLALPEVAIERDDPTDDEDERLPRQPGTGSTL